MRLLEARFPRACLAGAVVAAPLGALVQHTLDWEILYVHTSTHWAIDAAIYAFAIALMALLAGALGLPFRWLARRLVPRHPSALASLSAAAAGLLLFLGLVPWSLDFLELSKLYLVLAVFYGVLFAWLRPARARVSEPEPEPGPT